MNRHDWPLQVALIATLIGFNLLILISTRS